MREPKYWMQQAYGDRVNKVPKSYSVTMMFGEVNIGTARLDPTLRVFADAFMGWRVDRYIVHRRFCNQPTVMANEPTIDFRLAVDRARETVSAVALWHAFGEHTAMEYGDMFHAKCGRDKGRKRGGWHFTQAQLLTGLVEARIEARKWSGLVVDVLKAP